MHLEEIEPRLQAGSSFICMEAAHWCMHKNLFTSFLHASATLHPQRMWISILIPKESMHDWEPAGEVCYLAPHIGVGIE